MPFAVWTTQDLLIIVPSVLIGSILFSILSLVLFGDSKTAYILARYAISIGSVCFLFFWLKKKYDLSKDALGLRKGSFGLLNYVIVGIASATIYSLIVEITPLKSEAVPLDLKNSYSYLNLILLPLSISGFATIVLAPISEEIMDRGFIYGYLRRKIGVVPGLLLQALLFSLLHLGYLYGNAFSLITNRFFIGLILGFLYEKTGSIYPSMICHGTFNYLVIILAILKI